MARAAAHLCDGRYGAQMLLCAGPGCRRRSTRLLGNLPQSHSPHPGLGVGDSSGGCGPLT